MEGLEKFREAFKDYSENYVIIGGTACDIEIGNTQNDYPHLSVTTSSPKGNRQEVSVHVGNYFM